MASDWLSKLNCIDVRGVCSDIKRNGYCHISQALDLDFVCQIKEDVRNNRYSFNSNRPGGVDVGSQYYNTFMMCVSRAFYSYCTSSFVLSVAGKYLGEEGFRLKCHRYYETSGSHKMQWHTDTKADKVFSAIPGLIFISYISDVKDGEFQYIEGSHLDAGKYSFNDFSDTQILDIYGQDRVKSFKGSAGDLIIYNTAGIHRAKPAIDPRNERASLFFQVDTEDNSEPLYINPSFVRLGEDERLAAYLGFGMKSEYSAFPSSSFATARAEVVFREIVLPLLSPSFLAKRVIRLLAPRRILMSLQRLRNRQA